MRTNLSARDKPNTEEDERGCRESKSAAAADRNENGTSHSNGMSKVNM